MEKLIIFTFMLSLFLANVSAQLKVNPLGDILIGGSASNFIGTTATNIPITFKLGTSLAGFTGSSAKTSVSFGYGASLGGYYNVAIGVEAFYSSGGSCNTANGYRALYKNDLGHYNTATGSSALQNNTGIPHTSAGYYNTANGASALRYNSTGSGNTASGYQALYANYTGNGNTANGYYALYSNTEGNFNTAIGMGADVSANNLYNATAIGYGAVVDSSYHVRIGNSTVKKIGGHVNWSSISDGRAKKNIQENVPGLSFISRLKPVTYSLNLDVIDELERSDDPQINHFRDSIRNARSPELKEIEAKARADKEAIVYSGFIAQDVGKAAKSVGYDFSGVDISEDGKGIAGIRYAEFVVPLVKAVQELSEQNDRLQEQVNELTELVNKLLGKENSPDRLITLTEE